MNLAALLMAAALVGSPLTGDVGGYLERSAEAEYSGEQYVSCVTPDGDRTAVFDMAQVDGTVVAWAAADEAAIVTMGPGRSTTISGDEVEAAVVEGSAAVGDDDAYQAGSTTEVSYLGREAMEVPLLRDGDELRVLLTIDSETEAVVRARTYDAEGDLYCDRRMVTFTAGAADVPDVAVDVDVETASPTDDVPALLPAEIGGFRLLDTYPLDDGTLSYYSDGYFSVGVVVTDRPVGFDPEEDVTVVPAAAGEYQRSYLAGSVTVTWETREGNLAVIGDVPPDLVDSILAGLPDPASEGFFDRIWSRLFG